MDSEKDILDEIAAFFDPEAGSASTGWVDGTQLLPIAEPLNPHYDLAFTPRPEAQYRADPYYANSFSGLREQDQLTRHPPPSSYLASSQSHTHICPVCRKEHASRATLVRHMRFHTGERPFQCQVCDKTFAQKGDLKVHVRSHTGETPFSCWQCGKQFAQFTGLKYHERVHSGERPFQCKLCGHAFVHTGDLNVHMRTHTGEKPFACEICQKRFTQRGSVRVHMRRKHNRIVTKVPRTPDPALSLQNALGQ